MAQTTYPDPTTYHGQLLCRRCGADSNGVIWPNCAHPGYTHADTCMQYVFLEEDNNGTDVCEACATALAETQA